MYEIGFERVRSADTTIGIAGVPVVLDLWKEDRAG
jgi:hypothetical protein